jgi:hypothetical protein
MNGFSLKYASGDPGKVALFSLWDASAGDTLDLVDHFRVVKRCAIVGVTAAAALRAVVSGTVVTVPAGVSRGESVLTVYGVSAS